jgi:DNA processing protein
VAAPADAGRDELSAYLSLAQIPGIGAARLRTLVAAFGSAGGALVAPHGAIAALPGFGPAAGAAVRSAGHRAGAAILTELDRLGATVLLPGDAGYPPLLREIAEPPAALYVWGNASLLARPAAAIVGSRNHTPYGAEATRLLAAGVARAAVVVSGMARGLDAVAHQAALDAGGDTIGVLGNGFGVIYPAANRPLYERGRPRAVSHRAAAWRAAARQHLPRRNRIIAGLAGVTVVVEAAVGSGALITADCALDQGRSVLAVPGPITSPTSAGCNKLIQQGAKPALCVADVLEELGLSVAQAAIDEGRAPHPERRPSPADLNPLQRTLWDAIAAKAATWIRWCRAPGKTWGPY